MAHRIKEDTKTEEMAPSYSGRNQLIFDEDGMKYPHFRIS